MLFIASVRTSPNTKLNNNKHFKLHFEFMNFVTFRNYF